MTLNSTQVLEQIFQEAKSNKAAPRKFAPTKTGEHARQGDVYVVYVAATKEEAVKLLPKGSLTKVRNNRQLAEGETKGSRHILAGTFELFEKSGGTVLDGPTFFIREGTTDVVLEHPEHGHVECLSAGVYRSVLQKDCAFEEDRAVRD